ncbi:MAG TPA: helix-turn-helix domain-containing protein [Acidimicrobiales bacterium]|nr:helix-turn-helix domain-containing protein [Acidimicrobiales bacterium]
MDVTLLRWPAERDRRDELVARAIPRLLLLDGGTEPPAPADCLEDWARVGAADNDVRLRIVGLEVRASMHVQRVPDIDGDGVLRFNGQWVSLPPVEARLARSLVERFGTVVSRDALSRAGWPSSDTGRNALDVHILRLRRRIDPVSLAIRTVRSRGYLLEQSEALRKAN